MSSISRSPPARSHTRSLKLQSRSGTPLSGPNQSQTPRRSVSPRPHSHSPSPHRNGRRSPSPENRGRSRSRSRTSHDRGRSLTRSVSPRRTSPAPRSAKIVVEQLTKNVHEGHLREIFGHYGPIKDLKLPMNPVCKYSSPGCHPNTDVLVNVNRGTAYILFEEMDDAERAIAKMHEAQLDGVKIFVSIVLPRRRFSRSPPPIRRTSPPPRSRGVGYRPGGPPGEYVPPPMNGPPRQRSPRSPSRSTPRSYIRGGRGGGRGGRDDYGYRPRMSISRDRSRSRSPRRGRSYSRSTSRTPPRRGGGNSYRRRDDRSPSYSSYDSRSRSRSRGRVPPRRW